MGLTKIIEFATPASAKASLIDPPESNLLETIRMGLKLNFAPLVSITHLRSGWI